MSEATSPGAGTLSNRPAVSSRSSASAQSPVVPRGALQLVGVCVAIPQWPAPFSLGKNTKSHIKLPEV